MAPIVFMSQLAQQQQQLWIDALSAVLPNEQILLPQHIEPHQRTRVELAIVANPDVKLLNQYPNIIWLHSLWAGVETLLNQLNHSDVKIVRLVDPNLALTMAEAVLAWTMYLHRDIPTYHSQQLAQQWIQHRVCLAKDLNVSVLGAGALSITAMEKLQLVGYKVRCWSRSAKQLDGIESYIGEAGLQSMLAKTDILVNLLPLTNATHHMLNETVLARLPQGAKLINFSRGAIIDTPALLKLLDNNHLSHAVLDVFEQEPLPIDSPLWRHRKITVLPHISAPTSIASAAKIVADNIKQYRLDGTITHAVDKQLGY